MKWLTKNGNILIISIMIGFVITCIVGIYSNAAQKDIADNVFRLHVIANSDSKNDQELKLKVRDEIIKYMKDAIPSSSSKEQSQRLIEQNLNYIRDIAMSTILANGYNYGVSVCISNSYFPTKYYGDVALPSGNYDALKVEIGQAKGTNWWCVMYPPLCYVDASSGVLSDSSKQQLKDTLRSEDYNLITQNQSEGNVKIKFKTVEMWQKSKHNFEVAIDKIF